MIFGDTRANLTDIKTSLSGVIGDLKVLQSYAPIAKMFKEFNVDLRGLSSSDISSLQSYVNLLNEGKNKSVAFSTSMNTASDAAKIQARQLAILNSAYQRGEVSEEAYITATRNLASVQKTATATTKALKIGLDMLVDVGIMIAINLVITAIRKLINSYKEYQQKQEDLRTEAVLAADAFKQEESALASLAEKYTSIVSSADAMIEKEKALSELQDELIDKYGEKAETLDLVHEKYSQAIQDLQALRLEEAQEYLEEAGRKRTFQKAQSYLETESAVNLNLELSPESKKALQDNKNIIWFRNGRFNVGGTPEEQLETLKEISKLYSEQESFNNRKLQSLNDQIDAIDKQVDENRTLYNTYLDTEKLVKNLSLPEETQQQFYDLLEKARELNDVATGTGTAFERAGAVQGLRDIETEMYNLVGQNQEYREIIRDSFKEFVVGSRTSISELENLDSAWYDTLDDMQKGAIANIDKIKQAMQSLASGETLSDSEFWDIERLDTTNILNGVKGVEDVTLESLQKIKDAYIESQITTVEGWIKASQKAKADFDAIIRANKQALSEWKFADKPMTDPAYRKQYEFLESEMRDAQKASDEYGASIKRDEILVRQLSRSLGNTVDIQKALNDQVTKLTNEAEKLLKAYENRVDEIINSHEEEKKALESNRDALQEQVDLLEEQQQVLQDTIDDYKTVANVVAEAVQAQIDALKEQNEEREEALELAEKLANLENAKNNKVRTYTEAGGWTYEAKKADVQQAERELNKTQTDAEIKKLEEYLRKWQNIDNKTQKAEDERLADSILGADWREKIAGQDEDIFEMYDEEYQKYGESLYRISNIELDTARKSVDAANKEIAAKEKEISKWQEYKTQVTNAASEAKKSVEGFYDTAYDISLSMGSDDGEMARNLDAFYEKYSGIISALTQAQDELNESVSGMDFSSYDSRIDDIELRLKKLEVNWQGIREEVVKATREANRTYSSESEGRMHWNDSGSYADGGTASYTGLAMLHGTKQKAETIFNANDSAKLYDLVHNTPNLVASILSDGTKIASNLNPQSSDVGVTFNGTVINLPNVQNAEQFARQMEAYMQSVLSESQVYKPKR